jgi:hypothetical protein
MQRIQRKRSPRVSLTRSPSRLGRVLRLPRLRTTRFHGGGLPNDHTWREGVLSLKHRRCNETKEYHRAQQSPHNDDRLPGNKNVHARTSGDEEWLTIPTIILRKSQTFCGHLARVPSLKIPPPEATCSMTDISLHTSAFLPVQTYFDLGKALSSRSFVSSLRTRTTTWLGVPRRASASKCPR